LRRKKEEVEIKKKVKEEKRVVNRVFKIREEISD
jgi:hypothetical protein